MRFLTSLALLLTACAPVDAEPFGEGTPLTDESGTFTASEVAPPPGIVFDQTTLVAGDTVRFSVTGAAPGDRIYVGGTFDGLGAGPCVAFLGICLDLLDPFLLGTAVANNSGYAEVTARVPPNAPPIFVYTQVVVRGAFASAKLTPVVAPILSGHLDDDGDGYCGGAVCNNAGDLPGDCADDNPDVNPGQNGWFVSAFVDDDGLASFDWNCDGVETTQVDDEYACTADPANFPLCDGSSPGWTDGIAACGETANWGVSCVGNPLPLPGLETCFPLLNQDETQACR